MCRRQNYHWVVGFAILACLGLGPPLRKGTIAQPASPEDVTASRSPARESAVYTLLGDSIFAEGCKGGGPHGCMCPLRPASLFAGSFTLTPDPRTPPGHHAYDLTVEDWIVVLDGEEMQISGSGYYDKWTSLDGTSWQCMTLDLLIRGELVHFSSGLIEDPVPGGAFPDEILLTLDDGAECYGFVIALAAQRVPPRAIYNLLGDSFFAEGCKGGGPHGCMCPLRPASLFAGSFTLIPDPRTPPGHHAYDLTVEDWIVVLDGEDMPISGSGCYDQWTSLDGTSWQCMTLDLLIRGELVHFSSGVIEDPVPGAEFPDEILLTLDDGAECYGFVIALAAQRLP